MMETVWYWHQDRQTDQWYRISPNNRLRDTHIYSQLIFDKGIKVFQWDKNSLFKQMVLEQMDIHMQKSQ